MQSETRRRDTTLQKTGDSVCRVPSTSHQSSPLIPHSVLHLSAPPSPCRRSAAVGLQRVAEESWGDSQTHSYPYAAVHGDENAVSRSVWVAKNPGLEGFLGIAYLCHTQIGRLSSDWEACATSHQWGAGLIEAGARAEDPPASGLGWSEAKRQQGIRWSRISSVFRILRLALGRR